MISEIKFPTLGKTDEPDADCDTGGVKTLYKVTKSFSEWRIRGYRLLKETAKTWTVEVPYYQHKRRINKYEAHWPWKPVTNIFFTEEEAVAYMSKRIYEEVGDLLSALPTDDPYRLTMIRKCVERLTELKNAVCVA